MGNEKSVIIIAEAGVNHNGSLHLAKEMVEKAKAAGADYIKFQTFIPEELVTCRAEKAQYQKVQTGDTSQLEMLRSLALSNEEFATLKNYCDQFGIGFLSTPFDFKSIEFLCSFNMDYWKVPSGEITNLPYLEKIGKTQKKVILSTGMSEIDEIRAAVDILEENGSSDITILHCNTEYPTPFTDVNLLAMKQIESIFHKAVGYSDHTQGIEIPIAAVALGAKVIEKHFTLDRTMEGPDHRASLEPDELSSMVKAIRNVAAALGDGKKKRTASEENNINIVRKSIVAAKSIKAGEIFTEDNITVKRPGTGISPMEWHQILGNAATKNYDPDEPIEKECSDV
ncbi:MAG: N-acetylneuraminate synthase [Roseburia sp.]|nr:N-acetylneuraminate synthase [Roseburia sp.]